MAVMMIMMLVLIVASPAHMGTQIGHESPPQVPSVQQAPSSPHAPSEDREPAPERSGLAGCSAWAVAGDPTSRQGQDQRTQRRQNVHPRIGH